MIDLANAFKDKSLLFHTCAQNLLRWKSLDF